GLCERSLLYQLSNELHQDCGVRYGNSLSALSVKHDTTLLLLRDQDNAKWPKQAPFPEKKKPHRRQGRGFSQAFPMEK
ncbi:MAG: hypothetical protein WB662_06685, partial [Methyloceanibacter sp.]